MDDFIKDAGLILIALVLCLVLSVQNKSLSSVLVICACCMVCFSAVGYIKPIIDFVTNLQHIGGLDPQIVGVVIKAVGIGILSEIISLICADAGISSLGKTLQLLSTAIILWLSLPLLNSLMDLIGQILMNL